eukprot:TRINITY_DN10154_c0_g1_i2.p1 TRINITY_DN10154_c0_g1~~TRINITY_DN10154_c0_g1_i2.p1  ORF type:complete len:334 (-),score=77.83 TRINITY_DN10154_c0_g1_i2:465-1466(-)
MFCLTVVVVVSSFLRLASSQYSVADWSLPGFTQWQADLRNHARTQGRPHELNIVPQVEERSDKEAQSNGWLSHDAVNIQSLRSQPSTDPNNQNEKLQAILGRGNRMHTVIENLLKRSHHKKRETFNQKNVKNILSKQLGTESGLSEIIKQIIRNKLNRLQEEAHEEKSPVQILLAQSGSEETFLDKTVGRSGSFLDRLIKVMKDESINEDAQFQNTRKPKELLISRENTKNRAEETPLHFFKDVGLIRENQHNFKEFDPKENVIEDEKLDALKFFADAGLIRKTQESKTNVDKTIEENKIKLASQTAFLKKKLMLLRLRLSFLLMKLQGCWFN